MTGVILIFLSAIVLQTDSPNGRTDDPTFRVDSPTEPILAVFSPTNNWPYSPVGLPMWSSRSVYRKSYFLWNNRYTSPDKCIISFTFCKTIDTVVNTSVS